MTPQNENARRCERRALSSNTQAIRKLSPDPSAIKSVLSDPEGVLGPLDPRKAPPTLRDAMKERANYTFADEVWLLEPVRILSADGTYIEP